MSYSKKKHTSEVETEGGRRPTGVSTSPGAAPDPEVSAKAARRRFNPEEKIRVLEEADRCTENGQIGALLRREGLYSSHLSNWRLERRKGTLAGLSPQKRGRKAPEPATKALLDETKQLQRENERLRSRLAYAELIIDIQKKASEMLGIPLKSLDYEEDE